MVARKQQVNSVSVSTHIIGCGRYTQQIKVREAPSPGDNVCSLELEVVLSTACKEVLLILYFNTDVRLTNYKVLYSRFRQINIEIMYFVRNYVNIIRSNKLR